MQRGAKILVPAGTSASVAAKRQTSTIPIVFITVGDPVGVGLAESLSRPGGNVTGFSDVLLDLSAKYVGLAIELGDPQATVNYLWYTEWANAQHRFQATLRAAQSSGVKLRSRGIGDIGEANDLVCRQSGQSQGVANRMGRLESGTEGAAVDSDAAGKEAMTRCDLTSPAA